MGQKIESPLLFVIIVPIVHSMEDLRRCLTSLETLDYKRDRFHVVLVDCGVVNGVKEFLSENLSGYSLRVTTLFLPVNPSKEMNWFIEKRINEARNYAMHMVSGLCYIFTEDDCTFEPDWLQKFENSLSKEVKIMGGPDILPPEMGLFPQALDCLLNSYLGTAGMRRVYGHRAKSYYPRKENMAIPAAIFNHVGKFSEETPIGGEMDIAKRARDAGFKVVYLPKNPVWHWRKTSLLNFIRLAAYTAFQKVKLLRMHSSFFMSAHFIVLAAVFAVTLIGLFSLESSHARFLTEVFTGMYLSALFFTAVSSIMHARSVMVGLSLLLLFPLYHLSLISGIVGGIVAKTKHNEERH
ncbi:MAG TPA: glycosyltransferase [Thermodesulfobacteriota bacterium]|nr:glycosyltransferase [Thermodesulfobacteriota bacterium]